MCNTCGCNVTPANAHLIEGDGALAVTRDGHTAIEVLESLLDANQHEAAHNRQHLDQHGVFAINLMSSPGAGKTLLLEATIDALRDEFRIAVIEGDLETENDAERIRRKGIPAVQIATGTACHLDAHMVHHGLHDLDLHGIDLLFIENVGNLVCPAAFDLGHHRSVTLLSVTEGDDKPAKYPVIFRAAHQVLITKTDLLPYLDDFLPERAEAHVRALASNAPVLRLSAKSGAGMEAWLDWLRNEVSAHKRALARVAPSAHSGHSHHHHEHHHDQAIKGS